MKNAKRRVEIIAASLLAQEDWTKYAGEGEAADVPKIQGIELIIARILHIIVPLAGIILLVMIVAGGFQYITSGGEAEKAAKARKTITYAVFGLLAILLSWLIIRLLENFTGLNLTQFEIPQTN